MYSTMTYDEFVDFYKPIKNEITKYQSDFLTAFETYGEELEFVRSQPAENIWTEVDGDEGVYIINGYHLVNRIQYYVCEVPLSSEAYAEVIVSLERQCDCQEGIEIDLDSPVYCDECESGEGYISIYPDTREELIEIFGEGYANEVR
jgi:hypothetical protein